MEWIRLEAMAGAEGKAVSWQTHFQKSHGRSQSAKEDPEFLRTMEDLEKQLQASSPQVSQCFVEMDTGAEGGARATTKVSGRGGKARSRNHLKPFLPLVPDIFSAIPAEGPASRQSRQEKR